MISRASIDRPKLTFAFFLTTVLLTAAAASAQGGRLVLSDQPVLEISSPRGTSDGQFNQILGVRRTTQGHIVVAERGTNKLHFFDAAGRHLRSVGGTGANVGQFRGMSMIGLMESDTVLAFDMGRGFVTLFDANGNVGRRFGLALLRGHGQAIPQGVFGNGTIFSVAGPPTEKPDSAGKGYWLYAAVVLSTTDEKLSGA